MTGQTQEPAPEAGKVGNNPGKAFLDTAYAHPGEMSLSGRRPIVTRLSPRFLIGASASVCAGLLIALCFALWPRHQVSQPQPVSTAANILPDGIAKLPRDYMISSEIPKLGPPLPGDLGRSMFKAGVIPSTAIAQTPDQQRVAQAQDAALNSRLFVTANIAPQAPAAAPSAATPNAAIPSVPVGTSDQDNKLSFLTGSADHQTQSPERLQSPPSPYMIEAGTVISAALLTGLRSDLPGEITAQVTENTFDSRTGNILLIPQGSRLIGQYDAHVTFGQSRALLVWTRLILPNGKSIVLERQLGVDGAGYAGLEDEVDEHWGALFEAAALSTILSVGAEAGTSDSENNLAQAIRQGASQSFNQVGQQVVGRSLNVQPTITIRPGFPVRVLVTHDLVLEPYHS